MGGVFNGIGSVLGSVTRPIGHMFGDITGANQAADVQQQIAEAQLGQAREDRNLALQYAAPSANELSSIDRQNQIYSRVFALNSAALKNQEQIAASINPNILEASHQIGQLLSGGSSANSAGIMQERNRQRDLLRQQINEQLGPGAETSTAGIQALSSFDRETDNVRLNALSGLQGVLSNQIGAQGGLISNTNSGYAMPAQLAGDIFGEQNRLQNRYLEAIHGNPLTPYAGANYVGALGQALYSSQLLNSGLKAGAAALGGGGGAAAATQMPSGGGSPTGQGTYFGGNNPYAGGGQAGGQQSPWTLGH